MRLATDKPVRISAGDFTVMHDFVQSMWRLKQLPAYAQGLKDVLPATAGIDPGAPGILMGYDFHLTESGPQLIEINNNAGGLFMGAHQWLPQPDLAGWSESLVRRVCRMFPEHWRHIAIMDEQITEQFMYPEMLAYAELLRMEGRQVVLLSPEDIHLAADGLYAGGVNGEKLRLDGIYNRHTDFYLESPQLAHIRSAFESKLVQLNPHPRSYALLGDKGRMVDWWRDGFLEAMLPSEDVAFIRSVVPETRRLSDMDADVVWDERKNWVFKPAARHGGKGVLLGKGVSRKRFAELDVADTVMQRFVPASEITLNGETFRLDIRLFTHGPELVALAGRAWQGQMTNFRSEGSGWVSIDVGDS
ncbi:MAG: hypothetical protein COW19_00245 [Zetaproteobacteria bacterium CG12_big_fil_rev_8_21_14_0_65_55_1124]|nr:MAG: hypothetical protein COT53_09375 [Zetaproteobacteria bacterium CG08_land_8_20_14_0_20_55_17]PIW43976.1 MAG: hypothetical protein COW19_00245 [Zetaproteobacteria bacterium CG12_big_fil_rev_8_21_14_0_65_55_1124]PIY52471.1 MAG: hypothetical protein COZ01_07690 [Zetaproteobacteria bacterium CG_4_10_14_0_8_um_filter_55_43]PIZ36750.1 MAG: hypothetical protein COY36_11360 [Zetaproteobacteria bacterium CG_4_10_14_0_2_um_filter_55_20]PJB81064.1 MAG: hypothetical protein CO089_05590 [Zetaproteoba